VRLREKVAIITGAGRGLGRAAALLFAREGARVAFADFDAAIGEQTAADVRANGGDAFFVRVDVSSLFDATMLATQVKERWGRIDILVNNAGVTADSTLLKMTEEQFDRVVSVNLKGVFNCTKAVAPVMVEQGSGRVINTSSVVGLYGNFGQTNYAATKAGVIAMTKTWAKELGRKGITVNAVAPGFIATDMTATMPDQVLEAMREKVPSRRLGTPEEVAQAYLFLASDEAAYINGAVLSVDGGVTL
jgi:3-oxoacyl-[acyl-carrier protein] reductase